MENTGGDPVRQIKGSPVVPVPAVRMGSAGWLVGIQIEGVSGIAE